MFMPIMILLMGGTIVSVMWLGGHDVAEGTLLSGDLMAFFTYSSEIPMSLMMVSMVLMILTRAIACGKRIKEVLEEQPEITDDRADSSLTVENGDIRFEHVFFKYHPTAGMEPERHRPAHRKRHDSGHPGRHRQRQVHAGQHDPRLYEVNEGAVYVGGHNVKDYTMEALRDGCAMVLQKNTLFSGTIRENLWGAGPTPPTRRSPTPAAWPAPTSLSRKFPTATTPISSRAAPTYPAARSSACASILRRPRVLIMDDSTSAVDTATDAKIRAALKDALPGATKLIIAQRVTSVMDADMILVLDDGRIVGQGTHAQLMDSCDIYREVYESQQEGVSIDG